MFNSLGTMSARGGTSYREGGTQSVGDCACERRFLDGWDEEERVVIRDVVFAGR